MKKMFFAALLLFLIPVVFSAQPSTILYDPHGLQLEIYSPESRAFLFNTNFSLPFYAFNSSGVIRVPSCYGDVFDEEEFLVIHTLLTQNDNYNTLPIYSNVTNRTGSFFYKVWCNDTVHYGAIEGYFDVTREGRNVIDTNNIGASFLVFLPLLIAFFILYLYSILLKSETSWKFSGLVLLTSVIFVLLSISSGIKAGETFNFSKNLMVSLESSYFIGIIILILFTFYYFITLITDALGSIKTK